MNDHLDILTKYIVQARCNRNDSVTLFFIVHNVFFFTVSCQFKCVESKSDVSQIVSV